ncbi:MAG: efflux RND transporter periplasmic adaptor subunit [Methylotenera sp.]|nr:efflux RND transporter periplasmic adaptor subunit [Methylotenera sp.]
MNKSIIATAVISLFIGSSTGYWIASGKSDADTQQAASGESKPLFYRNAMNPAITSPTPAKDEMGMAYVPVFAEENSTSAERKPLFYRNPMNPKITSPAPAQDEMGMDYIPVFPEGGAATDVPTGTVKIDPTVVQNIGVRTTTVVRAALSRDIRTIGRVTYDEQRIARLHPKYDGWVEKLYINKTGDPVKKGSTLLSIYSPLLVATQEEYLLALNSVATLKDSPFSDVREGADSLLHSSRERLRLLDVPEHQINQIKTQRKVMKGTYLQSPFNGIVMNIGAREGERVTPETELYMIADISRVWVLVDIYEDDIPWVREGDIAKMQVTGIPGSIFTGKVSYIYPYLEAKSRTVKVRLEFNNKNLALKPDMFADVGLQANTQIDAVVIPSEAIVRTGTQEQVFVQRAPGQFEPRKVTVGVSANGQTQILSGLNEGEVVVASSQFLVDSESKLKEATAKMMEAAKSKPSATPESAPAPAMQPEAPMQNPAMKNPAMKMPGMEMPKKEMSGHEHMDMQGMESMGDMKSMNGGAQQ